MSDHTSLPSVEEVSEWSPDKVIAFLKSYNEETKLFLRDEDIKIIEDNWIRGSAFIELSVKELIEDGLKRGPAKTIIKLINKIKGEDQELKKKRKAEDELVITKPKKRKWMVNSAITREERSIVYFVDPTEQNAPLLESVHRGEFVALHGSRTSGKSTRVLQLQDQLNSKDFVCIYASFEHVSMNNVDLFWQTLGMTLQRNAPELFGPLKSLQIKSATDFLNTFHRTQWKSLDTVILFDEFGMLYNATEDNNLTTSPFNVNEPFQNPNFTLEQVQFIYKEFANEYELTIDQEVIEDIYIQTNGHAGLVCLCGRAIYRKLLPEIGVHLSYASWQRFATFLLGNAILEYLLNENSVDAMKLLRFDFLANFDPALVTGNKRNLALFLTAEGVLVPGDNDGTFKISSPFVRWMILQQIIPHVFQTSPKVDVPYHPSTGTLDIFEVLKQVIRVFDLPRESVYDAELYRIMSNWLGRFTVTGQWHLKYRASEHIISNKYIDIIISRPEHPTIALELLATATKKELKEHYERALLYDKKLPADETWVVHFTCCEEAISKPYWPTESQLQKGLRVVYFWHDLDFTKISIIACWLDTNNNTRHVTDVENW
ncbi:8880_t:CDS:2 [Gigaspora rosea]|nr:8880_t:CDS:2 [Gigaspora rosea]